MAIVFREAKGIVFVKGEVLLFGISGGVLLKVQKKITLFLLRAYLVTAGTLEMGATAGGFYWKVGKWGLSFRARYT
ncbi:hypothetical protein [Bacillus sp. CHD6a]|uniref:hypothetical protein n=1 Tax=Bacillus sp. CHD6a TaxID=1643452 RepID=UPI0006CC9062|nr:hypothetical protein [Bacillus sp. CHD6a]KPB05782.1 hypothetical protein AAV98_05745 [Bacillus sp. CHD6a]